MSTPIERVKAAIKDLQNGNMIILSDNPDREDEGDLIAPAETITNEQMNFMIRQGTGIVCLAMTPERLQQLNLPLMLPADQNTSCRGTPFTISIDAKEDITTGVSAADRTKTIHLAVAEETTPDDLVKPGHIFPLQAQQHGVLARQGHTEGSIDLVKLAGFKPAAVLCEIMNQDGTMARGTQLKNFAQIHQLSVLSIDDIIAYRLQHEDIVEMDAKATLPIQTYGDFTVTAVREKISGVEHLILSKENKHTKQPPLIRIHSSCITGDLFGSKRCDCHDQFHYALQRINEEGGMIIYLQQEGRGIGLYNKIKAYALQETGFDTVEANEQLGLPADQRCYHVAANILHRKGLRHIRLLTNNPAKINELQRYGITSIERVELPTFDNEHNYKYLKTKSTKLNHLINLDQIINFKRASS